MRIYLCGIFFQEFISIFSNILICQKYAKIVTIICSLSALINVVFDYIYIYCFACGIEGAAIASVIAQALGAFGLVIVYKRISNVDKIKFYFKNMMLSQGLIKAILLCGLSSFAMSITEVCIHATYNRSLQYYGSDMYIAVMTIIQSLMQIIYVFSNGLTQAAQPTISYYFGTKEVDKLKISARYTLIFHLIISCSVSIFLIVFGQILAQIFTSDKMVLCGIKAMLPIYLAGWWIFGIQSGVQCMLVGMGQVKSSLFLACLRKIVLLIPLMMLLPMIVGIKGIFMAEAISDTISGLTAGVIYVKKVLPIFNGNQEIELIQTNCMRRYNH